MRAMIDGAESFAAHFEISRETQDRLVTYTALLKQWQKTINLVAPSTLDQIWHRHITDSAQLLTFAKSIKGVEPQNPHSPKIWPKTWLDLGSGAGFPGLIIAILCAEKANTHHTLIESDSRKAAFLGEVSRKTGVPVDIVVDRIENSATHAKVGSVNCVTARALAPLGRLLELAHPYLGPDGECRFLKGREAGAEIETARQRWVFDETSVASMTDPEARIVWLSGIRAKT